MCSMKCTGADSGAGSGSGAVHTLHIYGNCFSSSSNISRFLTQKWADIIQQRNFFLFLNVLKWK